MSVELDNDIARFLGVTPEQLFGTEPIPEVYVPPKPIKRDSGLLKRVEELLSKDVKPFECSHCGPLTVSKTYVFQSWSPDPLQQRDMRLCTSCNREVTPIPQ